MKPSKYKIAKAKLFRWLKITKPIDLTPEEVRWIKLIKGHYRGKYNYRGNEWTHVLEPLFESIYGWDPQEHYHDFLQCMFDKLLYIHLKINDDRSGTNLQLREIFYASFEKGVVRDQERPIERAISELCGQIQNTTVIKNGVKRFYLNEQ